MDNLVKITEDLMAENKRLTDRMIRAMDAETLISNEIIISLRAKIEALEEVIVQKETEYGLDRDQLRAIYKTDMVELKHDHAKLSHENSLLTEAKLLALNAMHELLRRPDGFKKIYGESAYINFKLAFTHLGGTL
jgi:hypothetical protein